MISWRVARALSRMFEFRCGFGFGTEHAVSVLVTLQSTERWVTAVSKRLQMSIWYDRRVFSVL